MNSILFELKRKIAANKEMIEYWNSKPDDFWKNWKGYTKKEIISRYKQVGAELEYELKSRFPLHAE
jgi:hypothetical protein